MNEMLFTLVSTGMNLAWAVLVILPMAALLGVCALYLGYELMTYFFNRTY